MKHLYFMVGFTVLVLLIAAKQSGYSKKEIYTRPAASVAAEKTGPDGMARALR